MVTVTHPDVAIIGLHCSFGSSTTIPRPFKWHWKRDGVLIAGASSAKAYTTPPLRQEDFGRKYSVTVFGLDGEIETSNEVTLSHELSKEELKEIVETPAEEQGELE